MAAMVAVKLTLIIGNIQPYMLTDANMLTGQQYTVTTQSLAWVAVCKVKLSKMNRNKKVLFSLS